MRIKHTSKQFANESEALSLISDIYIFSVTFLCDNVYCDTCLLIRDQNRSEKSSWDLNKCCLASLVCVRPGAAVERSF